jgi:6,7-dimethyl-8-ribityllumazine synthase
MAGHGNTRLLERRTGDLPEDTRIVIVKTEWNASIVDELERGCIRTLLEHGLREPLCITVPGAVEIPFMVRSFWDSVKYTDRRPSAFIALGCVVKGDTPHFEYVCQMVSQGILQLNLSLGVPTVFGVLTVLDEQQAVERTGGAHGNKGEEAALTALSMIRTLKSLGKA